MKVRTRGLAGAALAAFLVTACGGGTSELEAAHEECRAQLEDDDDVGNLLANTYTGQLLDNGRAIQVEGKGEDDDHSERFGAIFTATCLLDELNAPESLTARMETTRALDGTQTASYDGYSYSWSYHPASGMNLLIEQEDE
jgi:hypothetical protein